MIPAGFHFLRPDWLLALIPAVLLAVLAWRRIGAGLSDWGRLVDAHLLRHLTLKEEAPARKWPVALLLAGSIVAVLAVAGPAWQKLPTPALDRNDPTVVVLSLAQSMNATDQSPTRLAVARHKVEDVLKRMRGGQVGLVIFADVPFVASPLTEDGRVVGQMLPELATDLMPVLDNRPDLAIAKAVDLLKGAGAPAGRIVVVTDSLGDVPDDTVAAAKAAAQAGYRVNVLGVGTIAGSTLLAFDGTPLRAKDGTPLETRLDDAGLARLAGAGGGAFTPLTADGRDLDRLFAQPVGALDKDFLEKNGLAADQWVDMGPWLLLLVLALAPLAFRRGWLAVLAVAALPALSAPPAEAADGPGAPAAVWRDLWQTPDQQAADAFTAEDYAAAAGRFQDPSWQASARYKAGDYEGAADAFSRLPGGDYNRGNALARAGRLEDAIAAYDAAIAADPGHADAIFNRDLVQKLLDQKKQQDNKDKSGNQGGGGQSSGNGQNKPDGKPGGQQGPQDKQKPQDQPGQQKPQDQQKPGDGKPQPAPQPAPQGAPKDPSGNPPPPKPVPPTPPKDEPSQGQPGGQKPPQAPPPAPQAPPPAPQAPPQASPPPAQQPPANPPPGQEAGAILRRSKAEQDQTNAQMLRMVPDDPAGLLRARIRAHYGLQAPSGPAGAVAP